MLLVPDFRHISSLGHHLLSSDHLHFVLPDDASAYLTTCMSPKRKQTDYGVLKDSLPSVTSLKPEQSFLVAIAAKAAVTNAPFEINETGSWWLPMGSQWLQALCKNVSLPVDVHHPGSDEILVG